MATDTRRESIGDYNHHQPLPTRYVGQTIWESDQYRQYVWTATSPSGIAYATSKHALVGYTKTLMIELNGTGVDVHLVCPGFIQTALFENATYVDVDKETLLPDTNSMMTAQEAAQKIEKGIISDKQWIIFPYTFDCSGGLNGSFPRPARYIWHKQWTLFHTNPVLSLA